MAKEPTSSVVHSARADTRCVISEGLHRWVNRQMKLRQHLQETYSRVLITEVVRLVLAERWLDKIRLVPQTYPCAKLRSKFRLESAGEGEAYKEEGYLYSVFSDD